MSINKSNGRPVYQHRRTQSSGLNTEGQPTTEQIEEGEIAINLTTRKIYTKRKQVIRGADSDFLEGPTVAKAGAIAYSGNDSDIRFPGFMPYGQQIKNGVKLKIIQRRLLDSDEAGKNITFQISQKYFLDYANALDYPRNSGSQWTGLANSTRSNLASNYNITYDGRHVPDSDEFGVTGNTTVNMTSTKSASSRLAALLHDSDGTAAAGVTAVNAVGGDSFGGGVVEISFNIDSDFTTSQVAERINNAIAASTILDTLDSKIICEIDSDNPEIVYIHGGDKVIDFVPSEKFVTYIDYGVTPLYKFYSNNTSDDDAENNLFQRDSEFAAYPKRIEVTFLVPSETARRVAVSGYTLPTTTKGFQKKDQSPLFNRPSVVLRDTVGNIGSIDSDNVLNNEFGFRSADFGATNEIVSLNAIASVGPNAPEFDVGSGNLWVEDRSSKTPRYDAVDSETHIIEVNIIGRNGAADGPIPASVADFEIDYGPLQTMAAYTDSDTKLLIEGGDTAESIAFKIYRLLSGITRSGKNQIEADSDATGIIINDVVLSNSEALQGPGSRSIGSEAGVTSQTSGYNIVKASFDSEHDSELFGYDIYIQNILGDSDGSGLTAADGLNRHKITVEAVKKSDKNKGDSDSDFTGMIIAISDKQQETNRVKAGRQAAELYYLDATLIDDITAQTIALTYDDDDARQAVNIVVYDFKPDRVNRDSDGAKRFAEWRKVTAPSILSPQAADFQVGGQTFSASATLRILDANGATVFSGSVLL